MIIVQIIIIIILLSYNHIKYVHAKTPPSSTFIAALFPQYRKKIDDDYRINRGGIQRFSTFLLAIEEIAVEADTFICVLPAFPFLVVITTTPFAAREP